MICFLLGEYERLWAAATGGRGTGRGRKKRVDIIANPENLSFGKLSILFQVFAEIVAILFISP